MIKKKKKEPLQRECWAHIEGWLQNANVRRYSKLYGTLQDTYSSGDLCPLMFKMGIYRATILFFENAVE